MRLGVLLALAFAIGQAADDSVVVGVLENHTEGNVARIAFRKQAGTWQAFQSDFKDVDELKTAPREFPARVDWTIASSGKVLGYITGSTPPMWPTYSAVGTQTVSGPVPRIGGRSAEFQQFGSSDPVYRPLMLVSRPNVRDPDGWKPARLADSYLKGAIPKLREAIKVENDAVEFKTGDVRALHAYQSKRGLLLFALAVHVAAKDDEVPGPELSLHWFAADSANAIRFLGSEMSFIDAGDYDNAGHSQVVFMKSSYDQDGYVLFFDDFKHSAEFSWHYQ